MTFKQWLGINNIEETTTLPEWLCNMSESTTAQRYSVEVNFRTKTKEAMESFAKIVLGYVSAALKQNRYHVKQVYDQPPLRIMVSSRAFDDGEWVGIISFNPEHDGGSFIISKGFYNKDRRSISIQSNKKCDGTSAAEITSELRNMMHSLKGEKDRHLEKLKPIPFKRGPKR